MKMQPLCAGWSTRLHAPPFPLPKPLPNPKGQSRVDPNLTNPLLQPLIGKIYTDLNQNPPIVPESSLFEAKSSTKPGHPSRDLAFGVKPVPSLTLKQNNPQISTKNAKEKGSSWFWRFLRWRLVMAKTSWRAREPVGRNYRKRRKKLGFEGRWRRNVRARLGLHSRSPPPEGYNHICRFSMYLYLKSVYLYKNALLLWKETKEKSPCKGGKKPSFFSRDEGLKSFENYVRLGLSHFLVCRCLFGNSMIITCSFLYLFFSMRKINSARCLNNVVEGIRFPSPLTSRKGPKKWVIPQTSEGFANPNDGGVSPFSYNHQHNHVNQFVARLNTSVTDSKFVFDCIEFHLSTNKGKKKTVGTPSPQDTQAGQNPFLLRVENVPEGLHCSKDGGTNLTAKSDKGRNKRASIVSRGDRVPIVCLIRSCSNPRSQTLMMQTRESKSRLSW